MKYLNKFYYFFFLASVYLLPSSIWPQNNSLGSWNILNLKYKVSEKYTLFGEAQLRSLKFYDHFHYYEYKGGITYQPYSNATFSLGVGSYQTYKEGGNFELPKNNAEIRVWPQVILLQSVGRFQIEQRYRAEMRFTSNGYRNRFRYRMELGKPFGNSDKGYKPYKISLSNELFFTNNEPYFERNRFLIAWSYKPNKNSTLHIGYLHQFDYKINDETGADFLQIGYSANLN
ncbi:MAG: DUF2490 domain-containing protein [Bacteroidia bacterium]|nr:DUF2490 domain-containing protein [Bacteroidia bacterium]